MTKICNQDQQSHAIKPKKNVTLTVADVAVLVHQKAFNNSADDGNLHELVEQFPESLNMEDTWGDIPLCNALLKDNEEALNDLINWCIEFHQTGVFSQLNDDHHTCLILLANSACKEEHGKQFLEHGADANQKDNMGRTALHYAVVNGKLELCKILIADGKYKHLLHDLDISQMTPLLLSVFTEKQPEILNLCLKYSSDVNHVSPCSGENALHMAIRHRCLISLKTLLADSNVDVNFPLPNSRTPLDLAKDNEIPEDLIEMMINRGAIHSILNN